jgi:hypothetical protein
MLHGDLSNKPVPVIVVVFEGAIAFCNDAPKHAKYMKKGRPDKSLEFWEINDLLSRRLLWLYHYKDVAFEIVTFLGKEFAEELKHWLDTLPFQRVWSTTPEQLGREVAYMPELFCIYDPEPSRWLMYGSKGRYLDKVVRLGEGL